VVVLEGPEALPAALAAPAVVASIHRRPVVLRCLGRAMMAVRVGRSLDRMALVVAAALVPQDLPAHRQPEVTVDLVRLAPSPGPLCLALVVVVAGCSPVGLVLVAVKLAAGMAA
jgi:hypothetical protein